VLRTLDRGTSPAYAQIEERLTEAISAGDLRPGDRLPPERELSERLGVSRMTLRQALESLERRGQLRRAVGRRGGTFVAEPKIERDLTALAGLTQQLVRQGRRAGARVVSAREGPAGQRTAAALGLSSGDDVFEVVRLRLSDGQPLALERSLFPSSRFPGLLERPLEGSLYELLEQEYGAAPRRAVERLEPVLAEQPAAEHLGVKAGAPLLLVERTAYDADGIALEFARDLFRGDRTQVLVESRLTDANLVESNMVAPTVVASDMVASDMVESTQPAGGP
jgi:GntR family transcriptional regulator